MGHAVNCLDWSSMFRLPEEDVWYHDCCYADDRSLAGSDHHLLCVVGSRMYPWAQCGKPTNPHFFCSKRQFLQAPFSSWQRTTHSALLAAEPATSRHSHRWSFFQPSKAPGTMKSKRRQHIWLLGFQYRGLHSVHCLSRCSEDRPCLLFSQE